MLNSARPSLRSTEECAIDRRPAADRHPKWKRRYVRSGKISSRNPQLAGGQLPAGDAAADDLGGRYVLGLPQHQVLIRAAARLVRADARGRPLGQVAADSLGADEQGRLEDPMLRGQIASFEIDEAALACAAERAVDLAKAGQAHPAFSSAMKYYGTELNKRRHEI